MLLVSISATGRVHGASESRASAVRRRGVFKNNNEKNGKRNEDEKYDDEDRDEGHEYDAEETKLDSIGRNDETMMRDLMVGRSLD